MFHIAKNWPILSSSVRKILLWICLFAYVFYFNQAFAAFENVNQGGEYVIIDDLIVNNENKYRTVIHKNEKEGILKMRKLINTSPIEECWTYLPSQEKWIEVGNNEKTEKKVNGRYITKMKLDIQLLDKLMIENDDMVVYHFHSSHSLPLEDEIKKRKEKGSPMSELEIEKEKTRFLIKSAYPSRSDLMNMIGNSIEFFGRNPAGNITFKIGSHYGITEFYLTEEGKAYFNTDDLIEFQSRITKTSSSAYLATNIFGEILELNPRQSTDPFTRIKMNPKQKRKPSSRFIKIEPLSRIKKAVEKMSDEFLRVTFTPYKQIK